MLFVVDHVNVVSVGGYDECRIILPIVLRAQFRWPIVQPAGTESGIIECVYLLSALDNKSNV